MSRPKPPGCTCTSSSSLNRMQALGEDLQWLHSLPWINKRRLALLARKLYLLSEERLKLAKSCPHHGGRP